MKPAARYCLSLLLLLPASVFAQKDITVSVSNLLRYGTGRETVGSFTQTKDYLENLTDSRLSFLDFTVGFRLLYDAPPEYGVEFQGISKRYVEFTRDDLYLRAGDSYSLFGKGLALNLFEDRVLAYDTGIEGLKAEYKTRFLRIGATGGDITYRDVLNLARTEHYRLRAATVELQPYQFLMLGTSFVSGKSDFPPPSYPQESAQFDIPEYFGRVEFGDVTFMVEYAEKRTTVYGKDGTHKGTAFYGTVSYAGEGIGVSLECKDYRYGIADPYQRTDPNRATKALAFQNAPIGHKEYSQTLLSRYPHIVDFNDEVGCHLDLDYAWQDQLNVSLSAALMSRHYSFTPTGDTSEIFLPIYGSVARAGSFLPNTSPIYSPFWEFYTDVQYYLEEGGNDFVQLALNRKSQDIADELAATLLGEAKVDATRSTAVAAGGQYSLGDGWAIKGEVEQQWVHEDKNSGVPDFQNHLIAVGVSQSPTYTLTVRFEWSSDEGTVDGKKNWLALDAGYRLGDHHTFTLSFGADRGGQVCANGVCRVVNPFRGVRASVLSYF
jgi:hypothetical protein